MSVYNVGYTSCSLLAHAGCVAPLLKVFDYSLCPCINACSESIPHGGLIQYGNYKDATKIVTQSGSHMQNMSAAVLYLSEVKEMTHKEGIDCTLLNPFKLSSVY